MCIDSEFSPFIGHYKTVLFIALVLAVGNDNWLPVACLVGYWFLATLKYKFSKQIINIWPEDVNYMYRG